jgi:hypothetical protein
MLKADCEAARQQSNWSIVLQSGEKNGAENIFLQWFRTEKTARVLSLMLKNALRDFKRKEYNTGDEFKVIGY